MGIGRFKVASSLALRATPDKNKDHRLGWYCAGQLASLQKK